MVTKYVSRLKTNRFKIIYVYEKKKISFVYIDKKLIILIHI